MKGNLKFFALGILGGMLPFGAFLLMSGPFSGLKLSDQVIDGNRNYSARAVSLNAGGISAPDFINASESSINSVVHVTTKVVQTSFQRDLFQEFFYGPGAGGREFKQYGSGSGSGVIVSSEGYIES